MPVKFADAGHRGNRSDRGRTGLAVGARLRARLPNGRAGKDRDRDGGNANDVLSTQALRANRHSNRCPLPRGTENAHYNSTGLVLRPP